MVVMTMEIDIYGGSEDPWDILPEETTRAFECFAKFRDAGPGRTIKATAASLGILPVSLKEWTGRHAWLDRARAYDLENDRANRVKLESERLEMRLRHAGQAVFLQRKVAERLAMLDPAELSPKDMLLAMDLASKLERVSRGDDVSKIELTGANGGPIELAESLSTQDRAALMQQVAAELAKRVGPPGGVAEVDNIFEGELVEDDG